MTSTFGQAHRATRKVKHVNSSVMKWHDGVNIFALADFVRGMTQRSPLSVAKMYYLSI